MNLEIETRFANIPRLCSFADELRYVNVRGASANSYSDNGRDQIDGRSNCRGRRDRNGRPHSSNADSHPDAFSIPNSGKHAYRYADLYFSPGYGNIYKESETASLHAAVSRSLLRMELGLIPAKVLRNVEDVEYRFKRLASRQR